MKAGRHVDAFRRVAQRVLGSCDGWEGKEDDNDYVAEEEEKVRAHCHDLRRAYALSTGENAGEAEVGGDSP